MRKYVGLGDDILERAISGFVADYYGQRPDHGPHKSKIALIARGRLSQESNAPCNVTKYMLTRTAHRSVYKARLQRVLAATGCCNVRTGFVCSIDLAINPRFSGHANVVPAIRS